MPKYLKLTDFKSGWIFGNFTPSIIRTTEFEICIVSHAEGEQTYPHYHKSSTEYNVILRGSLRVGGRKLSRGDIFVYLKGEVSDVAFLADSELLVVRIPSAPGDKVLV